MHQINAKLACRTMDRVCDDLLALLAVTEDDATIITHWQNGARPGFRIQVTSKITNHSLTRFAGADGRVSA